VLRIRDVYPGSRIRLFSIPDPGSELSIPDPGSTSKNLSIFNPKKWFLSSRKYDPGCSSRIPDPDADFLSIPDPRSRIQRSKRHRIPDPDPQHWILWIYEKDSVLDFAMTGDERSFETNKFYYVLRKYGTLVFGFKYPSVADPGPGAFWFLEPRSGMGKTSGIGSGIISRIILPVLRNYFLMRNRIRDLFDPQQWNT
jgi:hypothetical protein